MTLLSQLSLHYCNAVQCDDHLLDMYCLCAIMFGVCMQVAMLGTDEWSWQDRVQFAAQLCEACSSKEQAAKIMAAFVGERSDDEVSAASTTNATATVTGIAVQSTKRTD
jgi:hypothetical protein